MASIEYAETMVNTELTQDADIADVFRQDLFDITGTPGFCDVRCAKEQCRAGWTRGLARQQRQPRLGTCGHARPDNAKRKT